MNNRQPKRWCDECKQVVFALGHGHQAPQPFAGLTLAYPAAAEAVGRCFQTGRDFLANADRALAKARDGR